MKIRWLGLCALGVLAASCELQEVQLAETEDMIIAEVILRVGSPTQLAWLHRTRGPVSKDPLVENAAVHVQSASGRTVQFFPAGDDQCMLERDDTEPETHGSCYASRASELEVLPRETYRLSVSLPDGRALSGSTTVPADFHLLRPTAPICSVPPLTPFDVRWTSSATAWVYASETSLRGISAALAAQNIDVNRDPLRLFGFSVSARDTTIAFPAEFGVFDRFDDDLTEALAFLQKGLPAGVIAEVVIAAADRNYVNWERGGNFNPSGVVRVPSVHGDGTGVFGSIVPKTFQVRVGETTRPGC